MLLDEAGEPLRSDSLNRRKTAQSTRLPQISPISLISLLYAINLYAFFQQGFVSGTTFIAVAASALGLVAMFYGAFRSGFNTRFRDQSLMLPQIVASLLMMLCVAYVERDTQIALVPFVLIAFSFGAFFEYELAPWDFAAGRLFVEEAGGQVTTCHGAPLPLAKTSLLASNGLVHDEMVKMLDAAFGRP